MYRASWKRTRAAAFAALSVALVSCGSLVEEVASHGERLLIDALPMASSALFERPLPGCEVAVVPAGAKLSVLRHPTVSDLAVAVLEDGTPLCVDETAAILDRYPAAGVPAAQVPTGVTAFDQPRDDDPVPITNGGNDPRSAIGSEFGGDTPRDDDPVPIKGDALGQGTGEKPPGGDVGGDEPADDDPVPIHGQTSSSQATTTLQSGDDVDDDPVPIQPEDRAGRPPASW